MRSFINTVVLMMVAYFAPAKSVLLTTMALVIVDMITGMGASYKAGIPITSGGMKRTLLKIAIYQIAVLCAFVVQKELTGPDLPAMKWISALIGLIELKSVLENLDLISGGSFFRSLTDKLQGLINSGSSHE